MSNIDAPYSRVPVTFRLDLQNFNDHYPKSFGKHNVLDVISFKLDNVFYKVSAYILNANLESSNFYSSDLRHVHLISSNLKGVDFRNANIGRADFISTNFNKACFDKSFLTRINIDQEMIDSGYFNDLLIIDSWVTNSVIKNTNFKQASFVNLLF